MRTKAERRKKNVSKALRKRSIVTDVYGWPSGWYNNLHQYSKNKIHCSCPLCAAKTKRKTTHGWKYKGKQRGYSWSHADLKKIKAMEYEEFLYESAV